MIAMYGARISLGFQANRLTAGIGFVRSTIRRNLNRILFEADELSTQSDDSLVVTLEANDFRAKHINKILKLGIGDTIRCGIVDKGMNDEAVIVDTPIRSASVGIVEGGLNENATNSLNDVTIHLGTLEDLYCNDKPLVDLILAVPRPQKLERLLPIISCLGVGRIFLIEAKKVQKDYFGSHLLRRPDAMRRLLVEGLAQAEVDCIVPEIHICRNFRHFIEKDLDKIVSPADSYRVVAHPLLKTRPSLASDDALLDLKRVKSVQMVAAVSEEDKEEQGGRGASDSGSSLTNRNIPVTEYISHVNHLETKQLTYMESVKFSQYMHHAKVHDGESEVGNDPRKEKRPIATSRHFVMYFGTMHKL